MSIHRAPHCNLYLQDFEFDSLGKICPLCERLGVFESFCGNHPRDPSRPLLSFSIAMPIEQLIKAVKESEMRLTEVLLRSWCHQPEEVRVCGPDLKETVNDLIKVYEELKNPNTPVDIVHKLRSSIYGSGIWRFPDHYVGKPGEDLFISEQNYQRVLQSYRNSPQTHEKFTIAALYPYIAQRIRDAYGSCYELFSTEEFSYTPDLTVAPYFLTTFKTAYPNAPLPSEGEINYASFTRESFCRIRKCIPLILDGKVKLDESSLGEFFKYFYCNYVNYAEEKGNFRKGLVFDLESFVIVEFFGSSLSKCIKCKWTEAGSWELFRSFVLPLPKASQIVTAVRQAAEHYDISIISRKSSLIPDGEEFSSYLGHSCNSSFVLQCVKNGDGSPVVLKIVLDTTDRSFFAEIEYQIVTKIMSIESCTDYIMGNVPNSFYRSQTTPNFASFLMDFGTPLSSRKLTLDNLQRILRSLIGLHSCRVAHGNPRIENCVKHSESFKWVDFTGARVFTTVTIKEDIEKFMSSVNHPYQKYDLDTYATNMYNSSMSETERERYIQIFLPN